MDFGNVLTIAKLCSLVWLHCEFQKLQPFTSRLQELAANGQKDSVEGL